MLGGYFPNFSAVGKCAGNVAEELSKSHNITVICQSNQPDESLDDVFGNQVIKRVITREMKSRLFFETKIKMSKGLVRKWYQARHTYLKSFSAIKIMLSDKSINKKTVKSYLNVLKKLDQPIDLIIPVGMPYEAVVASVEYKKKINKKVRLVPYLFDHLVENNSLHRFRILKNIKKRAHLNFEKRMIGLADSILILKQLEEHYLNNHVESMDKVHVVEHPLLKKPLVSHLEDERRDNSFIYAGAFYKKIRNPEYMLELFDEVLNHLDGSLNIYAFGDCVELINSYSSLNDRIKNWGKVSSDLISQKLHDSNYLIAVGNSDNKQVPSKIFEYISYGKPILYLYSNLNDKNLEVLKKYPLASCLLQNREDLKNNLFEIIDFCEKYSESSITFEEAVSIYPDATPEHTATVIQNIIK